MYLYLDDASNIIPLLEEARDRDSTFNAQKAWTERGRQIASWKKDTKKRRKCQRKGSIYRKIIMLSENKTIKVRRSKMPE